MEILGVMLAIAFSSIAVVILCSALCMDVGNKAKQTETAGYKKTAKITLNDLSEQIDIRIDDIIGTEEENASLCIDTIKKRTWTILGIDCQRMSRNDLYHLLNLLSEVLESIEEIHFVNLEIQIKQEWIANYSNLRCLSFDNCAIMDETLCEIEQLERIEQIKFSGEQTYWSTNSTDLIPTHITSLRLTNVTDQFKLAVLTSMKFIHPIALFLNNTNTSSLECLRLLEGDSLSQLNIQNETISIEPAILNRFIKLGSLTLKNLKTTAIEGQIQLNLPHLTRVHLDNDLYSKLCSLYLTHQARYNQHPIHPLSLTQGTADKECVSIFYPGDQYSFFIDYHYSKKSKASLQIKIESSTKHIPSDSTHSLSHTNSSTSKHRDSSKQKELNASILDVQSLKKISNPFQDRVNTKILSILHMIPFNPSVDSLLKILSKQTKSYHLEEIYIYFSIPTVIKKRTVEKILSKKYHSYLQKLTLINVFILDPSKDHALYSIPSTIEFYHIHTANGMEEWKIKEKHEHLEYLNALSIIPQKNSSFFSLYK
ncbi:hypothetical protein NEOKW01_1442 [Nematocida sp. AWRm80]|nr:hypothetical protein NEOKW01_1442 [Nematocida sp. AWRm80]